MRHTIRMSILGPAAIAAMATVAVGLAACAATSEPIGGHAASATESAQSATATPTATAVRQTPANPGRVTVTVDKTHYAPTDTITVTIFNGLAASVSTTDHQTNCTMVTLERSVNGAWQTIAPCRLMTPTRVVPIPPGATTQRLGSTAWPVGTYRVVFHYSTEPDAAPTQGATPGQGGVVYSANFTIG
jgi:hypothetical protein